MASIVAGSLLPRQRVDLAAMFGSRDIRRGHVGDALLRVLGAPLVRGNSLRILRDATENYPAWRGAIESAARTVHMEMYIVHDDNVGREFRDLLAAKARDGVRVRVIVDWFGSFSLFSRRFWRPFTEAGGELRIANPPSLFDSLFGWVSRDHRKLITVDGRVAFISGLCIGDAWVGDPERNVPPWRDTGVEIRGPAVAEAEAAFADAWARAGSRLPAKDRAEPGELEEAAVALRVVATTPQTVGIYRMDLLVAAQAQTRLWLTDAYFIGTSLYIAALRDAARDGVDVRLLVPHGSDIGWVANVSRTMYRALLEGGVRVFEWNGPMIHAKTAVADGRWARIGSTNLNVLSWIGNWELDVSIEDERIGREMEEQYLADLANATEIVMTPRRKVRRTEPLPGGRRLRRATGSGKRMLNDAARIGGAFSAAVRGNRPLDVTESVPLMLLGGLLLALATLAFFEPRILSWAMAILAGWSGLLVLVKGVRLRMSAAALRKPRPSADSRQ
jgi:cardiolipin synthase A/B